MNNKSRERELAMLRQQHLLQFKDEFNKEMKNVEDYVSKIKEPQSIYFNLFINSRYTML